MQVYGDEMTDSKVRLREQLASDEAELLRLQQEMLEIEERVHPDFRDASRVLRLRESISAVVIRIFHTREHLARDPE